MIYSLRVLIRPHCRTDASTQVLLMILVPACVCPTGKLFSANLEKYIEVKHKEIVSRDDI